MNKQAGDRSSEVDELGRTLAGSAGLFNGDEAAASYGAMWAGWIVAIIGGVLLLTALIIPASSLPAR